MEWIGPAALAAIALISLAPALVLRGVRRDRMQLAALGRRLLTSPHLTEREKKIVDALLEDAFDWRIMWRIMLDVARRLPQTVPDGAQTRHDPDFEAFLAKPDVAEFLRCFMRSAEAANPAASLFVWIVFAVLARRSGEAAWRAAFNREARALEAL